MRARPTVRYIVDLPPTEILARFQKNLETDVGPCTGTVGRQEVTLFIGDERRRLWSPFLQLGVTGQEGGSLVHGTMGPQPNLWTAFVFVYASLLVVFTAGTMYGFVQSTLDQSPTGLAAAALGLVGLAGSCGLDLLGRKLGAGQMGILRGAVQRTLPEAVENEESPADH